MTTRNLDALFSPRAVALIGASVQPGSVGQMVARNLVDGGFAGPVMMVNPHEDAICSSVSYRNIAALPVTPDLAVVATPARTVPGVVAELGAKGCRAAVIISAGFEVGPEAAALRQATLDAARPHLMRIVGPNCLGLISPALGLNASFAHLMPTQGGIALVSQSGAVAAAALDWAAEAGVGFSHLITVGDEIDVDFGDLLGFLAKEPETKAILLYVEGLTDGPKFMRAARLAALTKPVVMLKAGRSSAGAKAAFSHTGALAGSDIVYDAALRQAGVRRVEDLRAFFETAAAFSAGLRACGRRLAILTNGGGAGVLAVDALTRAGGQLAELSVATIQALADVCPANWSRRNPVDILGDAQAASYASALKVMMTAPEIDAVLVINCPTAVADGAAAAEAVSRIAGQLSAKPVLPCWLGGATAARGRQFFSHAGQAAFETPEDAVGIFLQIAAHSTVGTVPAGSPLGVGAAGEAGKARAIIARACADGRDVLSQAETKILLTAYGIPVIETRTASTPAEAGRAAAAFAGPVALKILSPDISHKVDVGGVRLNLVGAAETEAAATAMLATVWTAHADARIDGFTVEPMIARPHGQEVLAGIARDPVFGPIVLFGQGGTATEILADRCVALPPLDASIAGDMIGRTRVSRLLAGYRNHPPANLEAVNAILMGLGRMAVDLPQVAELDINPLVVDETGARAIDARVRLRAEADV